MREDMRAREPARSWGVRRGGGTSSTWKGATLPTPGLLASSVALADLASLGGWCTEA